MTVENGGWVWVRPAPLGMLAGWVGMVIVHVAIPISTLLSLTVVCSVAR